ncbi:MAG: hypothetical protein JST85_04350 [Acidobacteria bacterium]|nr:hypothetical protein [Acidobacteriota bacterium]
MKKQMMNFVATIGFLFVLSSVSAFAQTPALTANVPFDFQVNGKTMVAGKYTIAEPSAPRGTVIIRSIDWKSPAVSIFQKVDDKQAATTTQLVFHRYGDKYFLAKMQIEGQTEAMQLPTSKAERELVKELSGRHLANNKVEPEIVTVALVQ